MSNSNSLRNWFQRIDILALPDGAGFGARCPRCGTPYPIGPIFDHHARCCPNCRAQLREWNLNRFIYLIDVEQAPRLVQNIIAFLDSMPEPDAAEQLQQLAKFLGVDTP